MMTCMLLMQLASVVNHIRNQAFIDAFGKHIKELRLAKGLSRETLAAHCDIEVMQIYRIETGKVNTTISTLLALSKGLELQPKQLLEFQFS